jgi:pyruvate/2-oxoglutarate/acetoin dehydrogenase E1 component
VPDDRMLWTETVLMRFAEFPTINSILSNAAELRRKSRHVFGVPMEDRTPMTTRRGASEFPHSN